MKNSHQLATLLGSGFALLVTAGSTAAVSYGPANPASGSTANGEVIVEVTSSNGSSTITSGGSFLFVDDDPRSLFRLNGNLETSAGPALSIGEIEILFDERVFSGSVGGPFYHDLQLDLLYIRYSNSPEPLAVSSGTAAGMQSNRVIVSLEGTLDSRGGDSQYRSVPIQLAQESCGGACIEPNSYSVTWNPPEDEVVLAGTTELVVLDHWPMVNNAGNTYSLSVRVILGNNLLRPAPPIDPVLLDTDTDGVYDRFDNCPNTINPLQDDADSDGLGDVCDPFPYDSCNSVGMLLRSTTTLMAFQDNSCEDWSGVSQPGADLQSAVLRKTDLSSGNLNGALFLNANLSGASLANASLVSCQIRFANLDSAIMTNADLAFTSLLGSNLASTNLTSADLSFAVLTGATYNESTIFPSGNSYESPPWGLDGEITPWDAGMIPVPEPSIGLLLSMGALGLVRLAANRRA